ncbi:MAG: ABC transporter ATP-binding protein [Acidimicrobiia bacterium]
MNTPDVAEYTGSKVLRRAFRVAPALRSGMAGTLLLAIFGTGLQVAVPILIQQILDRAILTEGGADVDLALRYGGIALVFMVASLLAQRAALVRLTVSSATGLADLRLTTFSHLHRLSVVHLQSERKGALVARVTSDVDTMQEFMEWGGLGMIIGGSQVILAVAVMLVYRWQLALMVVIAVIVYAAMLIWFQRILQRAYDRVRERVADSMSAISEAISGIEVVRAYGMEPLLSERVHEKVDEQFRAEFKTYRFSATLFSSAELFAGIITAIVIAAGVIIGVDGGVTLGTLVAFLFLVNLFVEPVQMLVEVLNTALSAAAGLRKVLGVIDVPVDIPDPVDGTPLPDGGLDVRFEGVRFRYPTGGDVLMGIDAHISSGLRVAVVGETGSGKTTFAKLVVRLLDPTEGRVLVGGVPVDTVPFRDLRRRVAFVPQEGFLFEGTVADNVRYGRPEMTDPEVRAAFLQLELGEWLDQMPDGLDTQVGERGNSLSSGERQLVALVRAWVADPDLLVLDEATSAVDPALEVGLRRAMERLTEGRTSITVAHRLSTAEAADSVLVFDDGRLVETGSHRELVALGGVYADLHIDWQGATKS